MEYEFKSYRKGVRFIKFLHSATVGCKLGGGTIEAIVPHYSRKELTARLCKTQLESDDCYETDSDGDFKFDLKYEFYKYIKKNTMSEVELLNDYSKYRIRCDKAMKNADPFYNFYQSRIKNWRSHCNKGVLSSPEVRLATSRFKELLQKYSCQGDHFNAQALAQACIGCDLNDSSCYQLEHDLDESYQLFMSSNSVNTFLTLFPKPPCRQLCSDDSCNHEMATSDSIWHCHRLCCHYFDSNAEKDADALLCKYVLLRHFGRKYYRKHHKRA